MAGIKSIFSARNSVIIITILHSVGVVGIMLYPDIFLPVSVFNILISAFLVFIQTTFTRREALVLLFIVVASFIIEYLGTVTGKIFGEYKYGENLGPKFMQVPLVIGLNWALLMYCSLNFFIRYNKIIAIVASSVLMVILDFFMEQSASKFDFWHWKDDVIPVKNSLAWFAISLVFSALMIHLIKLKPNPVAWALYVIQFLFFTVCFLLL
jgi:putative membrane protein